MSTNNEALEVIQHEIKPDALAITRAPNVVLNEARKAAKALTSIIEAKPKKLQFNGKTYLQFEDWQTLGRFYGVTAVCRSTKFIEYGEGDDRAKGFEATADALLVSTNQVISSAEAICLDDERNWAGKPLFQIKSMAQTRAAAKALRNVLAWVVVLAGYAPTPAEEMESESGSGSYVQSPRRKSQPAEASPAPPSPEEIAAAFDVQPSVEPDRPKTISEKQQKRLFAIAKSKGWTNEEVRDLLAKNGFEHSTEIPTGNVYNQICAELELRA